MVDVENGNGSSEERPGWQTTEFWMGLVAVVITYLINSGVATEGSWLSQVLGIVGAVLVALGYMKTRQNLKLKKMEFRHQLAMRENTDA
jgi:hypothetical protein